MEQMRFAISAAVSLALALTCASCQVKTPFELNGLGQPFKFDCHDMDSDGKPDIIVSSGDKVEILYQRDGLYSHEASKTLSVPNAGACKAGDFDADGKADLAVVGTKPQQALHLFLGKEALAQDHVSNNGNQFYNLLSAGKLGGSGKSDFLVGPVRRSWDGSNFAFSYFAGPKANDNAFALIADMDNDGFNDAIFASAKGESVRIYYGPFGDAFRGKSVKPTDAIEFVQFAPSKSPARQLAVADFNGDHRPDIAAALDNGDIAIYFQNSPIGFSSGAAPSKTIKGSGKSVVIEAADIDGDGLCDLIVAERKSGLIRVLLQGRNGLPDKIASEAKPIEFGSPVDSVKAIDIDGDRIPEILAGGENGTLKIFKIR